MVESALQHVRILEELDFYDIVISLKASSVPMTIAAYRLMSEKPIILCISVLPKREPCLKAPLNPVPD